MHLYFPGWVGVGGVGVVIIKLKANLSSTSHLTSQLELSLATPPESPSQLPFPLLAEQSIAEEIIG